MDIDELRSRVTAELPRIRQDLEDLVRIESVSADPARAARGAAQRRGGRRRCSAAEGFEDTRIVSARDDGGAPAVLARKPAPDGQADGAPLRPPRRAARERPRRVGLPAVRADRARRPPLRPRRGRRQGRHRRAPRRRSVRSATTSAWASRCSSRARRRSGPTPCPTCSSEHRDYLARRRDRDRRQRQLGHRRPRPDHQPARAGAGRRRGAHADPRRALRHVGRAGARRADDADPADRHAARRRGQRRGRRPALRTGGRRRLPRGTTPRRVRHRRRAWSSSAPARRSSGCGPSRR